MGITVHCLLPFLAAVPPRLNALPVVIEITVHTDRPDPTTNPGREKYRQHLGAVHRSKEELAMLVEEAEYRINVNRSKINARRARLKKLQEQASRVENNHQARMEIYIATRDLTETTTTRHEKRGWLVWKFI